MECLSVHILVDYWEYLKVKKWVVLMESGWELRWAVWTVAWKVYGMADVKVFGLVAKLADVLGIS